jgi:hypothetical protein
MLQSKLFEKKWTGWGRSLEHAFTQSAGGKASGRAKETTESLAGNFFSSHRRVVSAPFERSGAANCHGCLWGNLELLKFKYSWDLDDAQLGKLPSDRDLTKRWPEHLNPQDHLRAFRASLV